MKENFQKSKFPGKEKIPNLESIPQEENYSIEGNIQGPETSEKTQIAENANFKTQW